MTYSVFCVIKVTGTTVSLLADMSPIGDEMRFSLLTHAKIGFPDSRVSRVKRARKVDNSALQCQC